MALGMKNTEREKSERPNEPRATIEVYQVFSEVPRFESSIPFTKTYLEKRQKQITDEKSHGLGTRRKKMGKIMVCMRRFWVKNLRRSENI